MVFQLENSVVSRIQCFTIKKGGVIRTNSDSVEVQSLDAVFHLVIVNHYCQVIQNISLTPAKQQDSNHLI